MQPTTGQMIAEKADGIGWMTFSNLERHNAINLAMRQAIPEILGDFAADPDVRVVVMKGAGDRAFVSGADISEFEAQRSNAENSEEYARLGQRSANSYKELGKPLIAMIRGYCLGGGLVVAMKADLRIAAEGSQFGIPAVRLGVGYAYQSVKEMVDLIGPGHTRRLLITGERVDAQTALSMGLVSQVVPADELEGAVRKVAATIAGNAPLTIRAIRAAVDESLKGEHERDVDMVNRLVTECAASQDYAEGRRAFMEKRRPVFTGR